MKSANISNSLDNFTPNLEKTEYSKARVELTSPHRLLATQSQVHHLMSFNLKYSSYEIAFPVSDLQGFRETFKAGVSNKFLPTSSAFCISMYGLKDDKLRKKYIINLKIILVSP